MNILLDVETIDRDYNFICDLSYAIIKRNKIVEIKNFLPLEHLEKMTTGSFSASKTASTLQEFINGNAIILPYEDIMQILVKDLRQAKYIYAYNANFDRGKIIETAKLLRSKYTPELENPAIFDKWRCLWAWASHTIMYKKSYLDFCEVNNFKTPKGFYSTSAETVLKFLTKNLEYNEQHTARRDVLDEFLIYQAIKQKVKREYGEVIQRDEDFKSKPFFTLRKLDTAINS